VSTRIAYLGPAGTFTEDALRNATAAATDFEPLPAATIHDAILAVEHGEADRALVPFENSIEGSVRPTLDTLALEAEAVAIVGEFDYPVRVSLIARQELPLAQITAVLSHPQASAQCARFIREQLPDAEVRATASTADAVRTVSETEQPWAALGAHAAADLYGCIELRAEVEDSHDPSPSGSVPSGAIHTKRVTLSWESSTSARS